MAWSDLLAILIDILSPKNLVTLKPIVINLSFLQKAVKYKVYTVITNTHIFARNEIMFDISFQNFII